MLTKAKCSLNRIPKITNVRTIESSMHVKRSFRCIECSLNRHSLYCTSLYCVTKFAPQHMQQITLVSKQKISLKICNKNA